MRNFSYYYMVMKIDTENKVDMNSIELKRNFVSVASHEIRTPLSSILLSVSLIEKYTQQQQTELIFKQTRKIKNTITNLKSILEDFLSLEKLDTGQVTAAFETFDLAELSNEIIEEMQEMALPDQKLRLICEVERSVNLDRNLLKNAIINLISNAIKYAGAPVIIELKVYTRPDKTVIRVTDNGIGIQEVEQANLFRPFYRIHSSGTIPGTGLGLTIVQRYIGLMKGTITFESKPGQKTSFKMVFPAQLQAAAKGAD
jgi:signal transduction histidine kinase